MTFGPSLKGGAISLIINNILNVIGLRLTPCVCLSESVITLWFPPTMARLIKSRHFSSLWLVRIWPPLIQQRSWIEALNWARRSVGCMRVNSQLWPFRMGSSYLECQSGQFRTARVPRTFSAHGNCPEDVDPSVRLFGLSWRCLFT